MNRSNKPPQITIARGQPGPKPKAPAGEAGIKGALPPGKAGFIGAASNDDAGFKEAAPPPSKPKSAADRKQESGKRRRTPRRSRHDGGNALDRSMPSDTLVVESVTPAVDAGRHAAKRIVGDLVEVGADVYMDGHDLFRARIAFLRPDEKNWEYTPMVYDYNSDRCYGRFAVDRIGRWTFTVEAWPDTFGSWQSRIQKKLDGSTASFDPASPGGQDLSQELAEGALLLEHEARRRKGESRKQLKAAADRLADNLRPISERVEAALAPELADWMAERVDPERITRFDRGMPLWVDRPRALFASWYEMFPRSQSSTPGEHGTFADAKMRLSRLAELGFDVIYLPPIHPIGKTLRKGPNNTLNAGPDDPGSPWAIGSDEGGHTAIDARLGTSADFRSFVRECQRLGMEVALDYALQCSPDHPWLKEHPDWFFVRPDGTIKYAENPPKKYQDIYPLNFWCDDRENLWTACRDIFLHWINEGVRIFRVDNPHTKPLSFWKWVIGEIHRDHPDVIFLSEAFTRPKRMKGLAKLGFTQSYTYFTWRNSSWELREYLTELTTTNAVEYFRPNFFANTPDILHEYLQNGGRPAFRVRLLLAATLSPLYGIYSGFELCENVPVRPGSEEYLNSEKYEIRVRDWDAPGNINGDVARINEIRRAHPALQRLDNLRFCETENEQILCYHKYAPGDDLLIVANLDPNAVQSTMVTVPIEALGIAEGQGYDVEDLLTDTRYRWTGRRNFVLLDPARQPGHLLRIHTAGGA